MLVYVDTNIFLDALDNRKNLQGRDVSSPAFDFFKRAAKCEFRILFSSHTAKELNDNYKEGLGCFFVIVRKKLIKVPVLSEDKEKAIEIQRDYCIHYADALHTALALRLNAGCIVSRNKEDFNKVSSLIKTYKPENL